MPKIFKSDSTPNVFSELNKTQDVILKFQARIKIHLTYKYELMNEIFS